MSHYYSKVFNQFNPNYLKFIGDTESFKRAFNKHKLLICGESHGVRENADITYSLAKLLKVKELAIERPVTNYKDFIETAFNGSPNFLIPQAMQSLQSSVLSVEMLKAIASLYNENAISAVQFVDIDKSQLVGRKPLDTKAFMKVREEVIAKNILNLPSDRLSMVILGSYHTRLELDDITGGSSLIRVREYKNAVSLTYNYQSGEQYNSGKILKFENRLQASEKNKYQIKQISGTDFILDIPIAHKIRV